MEKKVLLLGVVVVGVLCSAAFALAPMGPPTATLKQGQFGAGVEYSYSKADLKVSGHGFSGTLDDVKSNMFFGNLGYGLIENWEAFLRLGTADVKGEDFSGGQKFAWGFGTKATFVKDTPLAWGGLFQMHWLKGDDTWTLGSYSGDAEVDVYEMQIAAGPTWQKDGFCIYGGPFLHFVAGDLDIKSGSATYSFNVKQDSEFGGYVGAQCDLANWIQNASWNAELQLTGDAWAFATGVIWRLP
jgi:hypothetical protein